MDDERLASLLADDNARSHHVAAFYLMQAGARGIVHLPQLLDICETLGPDTLSDAHEESFVLNLVCSTGRIVCAAGYDEKNRLHRRGVDWIHRVVSSPDVNMSVMGVFALGDLGHPPTSTIEVLSELARNDCRFDPSGMHTLRSVAFRMLARMDQTTAAELIDSPACAEYVSDMRRWIATADARRQGNFDRGRELRSEIAWLCPEYDQEIE